MNNKMNGKIELRKVRDFGELINDSFLFTFQNWKQLLKITVTICGFFILASVIAAIFQQQKVSALLSSGEGLRPGNIYGIEALISIVLEIVSYMSISLTVLCYMNLYLEKGNEQPALEEVWSYFKYYFWRFLGSNFLLTMLFIIGFFLCFIPGIYLVPIISIIFSVMIFENATLGYSFDRGVKLVKGNWWTTFGAILIMLIVFYVLMIALLLPVSIASGASVFLGQFKLPFPLQVVTSLLQHIAQLFSILLQVVVALAYFSLVEKKEGSGLLGRIDHIGRDTSQDGLPEEQY